MILLIAFIILTVLIYRNCVNGFMELLASICITAIIVYIASAIVFFIMSRDVIDRYQKMCICKEEISNISNVIMKNELLNEISDYNITLRNLKLFNKHLFDDFISDKIEKLDEVK